MRLLTEVKRTLTVEKGEERRHSSLSEYDARVHRNASKSRVRKLLYSLTQDINKPESPEWSGLLIDGGGYWLGHYLPCVSLLRFGF
ncbi:hypothetical protein YC2023_029435 [Brassica napus]